jgi:hypothetical protein
LLYNHPEALSAVHTAVQVNTTPKPQLSVR